MYIIETTKEDLRLAKEEIKVLSKYDVVSYNNLFIADCDYSRLALANHVYKILDKFPKCDSFKFEEVNIPKKKAFSYVAELKEKGAKVDLKNPSKVFALVRFKKQTYLCERIYSNPKDFLKRHPKHRPEFHPGACIPKFSKELVNLSGVKSGQLLVDPFCGTGGMLIEAYFMGVKVAGFDLSDFMLSKAKVNLKHYGIFAELEIADAMTFEKKCDVIVTELPFGKTTLLADTVPNLLSKFLNNIISKDLCKKVVVGLPSGYRYSTRGWTRVFDHEVYIHKSLSKRIIVLER